MAIVGGQGIAKCFNNFFPQVCARAKLSVYNMRQIRMRVTNIFKSKWRLALLVLPFRFENIVTYLFASYCGQNIRHVEYSAPMARVNISAQNATAHTGGTCLGLTCHLLVHMWMYKNMVCCRRQDQNESYLKYATMCIRATIFFSCVSCQCSKLD